MIVGKQRLRILDLGGERNLDAHTVSACGAAIIIAIAGVAHAPGAAVLRKHADADDPVGAKGGDRILCGAGARTRVRDRGETRVTDDLNRDRTR
jgi:hypothetical protein